MDTRHVRYYDEIGCIFLMVEQEVVGWLTHSFSSDVIIIYTALP